MTQQLGSTRCPAAACGRRSCLHRLRACQAPAAADPLVLPAIAGRAQDISAAGGGRVTAHRPLLHAAVTGDDRRAHRARRERSTQRGGWQAARRAPRACAATHRQGRRAPGLPALAHAALRGSLTCSPARCPQVVTSLARNGSLEHALVLLDEMVASDGRVVAEYFTVRCCRPGLAWPGLACCCWRLPVRAWCLRAAAGACVLLLAPYRPARCCTAAALRGCMGHAAWLMPLPAHPLQFNTVANECLKAGLGDKAEEVMEARDYL
jgi:pentatricopeptide repeat protein